MRSGEDEAEQLLRKLHERRVMFVDMIACGGAPPGNVPGGYMQVSGRVQGIDEAIALVKDVFSAWLPQDPQPKQAPKITDY